MEDEREELSLMLDLFLVLSFLCINLICALRKKRVVVSYCHNHHVHIHCELAASALLQTAGLQIGGGLCFIGLWTQAGALGPKWVMFS